MNNASFISQRGRMPLKKLRRLNMSEFEGNLSSILLFFYFFVGEQGRDITFCVLLKWTETKSETKIFLNTRFMEKYSVSENTFQSFYV